MNVTFSVKGCVIDPSQYTCNHVEANMYRIAGYLEGMYSPDDIDKAEVVINGTTASQVLYTQFTGTVIRGRTPGNHFSADVLL